MYNTWACRSIIDWLHAVIQAVNHCLLDESIELDRWMAWKLIANKRPLRSDEAAFIININVKTITYMVTKINFVIVQDIVTVSKLKWRVLCVSYDMHNNHITAQGNCFKYLFI